MRSVFKLGLVVVAIASFSATGFAQKRHSTFMRLDTQIVLQKLAVNPSTAAERVAALRKLFSDAGCGKKLREEKIGNGDVNVLCSTQGVGDSTIVVAAPLDYKAKGDDVMLRWGDLAMLPILAESMNSVLTRHSFVFVGVSGGHMGRDGAKAYLESLPPEKRTKVDAVVAFDRLGRFLPVYSVPGTGSGMDIRTGRYGRAQFVIFNPANYAITRSIPAAAARWRYPVPQKTNEFGADLTRPFHAENIPAITFTSPAWTVVRYIGDNPIRDYHSKLDPVAYDQTYTFLCAYLLHLDLDVSKLSKGESLEIADAMLAANLSAMQSVQSLRGQAEVRNLPKVVVAETPAPTRAAARMPVPAAAAPAVVDAGLPVFHAISRLVQVDVVALDKSGHPLEGLDRDDFTVLQDGHPQKATVFEAHTARDVEPLPAAGSPESAKAHVLNTYSNQPSTAASQSWNIILLDMLNTPLEDQKNARNQLQKIASSLPQGQPVALFVLTSKLVMVQAFTRDSNAMMLAVKMLRTKQSGALTTEAERQQDVGQATYIAQASMPSIPANAGVSASLLSDFQQSMVSNMLLRTKNLESIRVDERAIFTLDAFAGLARTVAGYPGRKNLIWLSGDFPIRVDPDDLATDKWRYSTDYTGRLTKTDALLTESRIAVYPIDIRGMQVRGVDIGTSTQQVSAFVGANGGSAPAISPDRSTDLTATQGFAAMNERKTMMEIAEQTGGHAFLNTNDFNRAIATAIEDGSIYYTLAYSPDTKDEKPTYHRIQVKLNKPGARLSYRRGYYSQPESATPATGLAALQGSLQPGMPPSTMLFFTASVKPPDATHKTVRIDYVINGSNVTLKDAANGGKHVLVDCMAIAYDREGKEVAHASDTLDGTLPAAAVQATLARGLPANEELALKPGVYNLRVGVQDRESGRIGTVTIPIAVE